MEHLNSSRTNRVGDANKNIMRRRRTVVVKFTSYKEKEAILKKARRIKPEGLNIFEDLAEETMEKRRAQLPQLKQAKAQGKIAYFSLDKLIIRDRPTGSIHGLNV